MKYIYHKQKSPTKKQIDKYVKKFLESLNSIYKDGDKEFRFSKTFIVDKTRYFIYFYGLTTDKIFPEYSDGFCINILKDKNFYFIENTVMVKKENIVFNFSSFTKKLQNEITYLKYEKRVFKRKAGNRRIKWVNPIYICSNALKDAGMIFNALFKQGF